MPNSCEQLFVQRFPYYKLSQHIHSLNKSQSDEVHLVEYVYTGFIFILKRMNIF